MKTVSRDVEELRQWAYSQLEELKHEANEIQEHMENNRKRLSIGAIIAIAAVSSACSTVAVRLFVHFFFKA